MSSLNYDSYQFQGRRALPVSAASSIAFSDYNRMHTEFHQSAPAAWVPPFALNDKQLQEVLLLRAWRHNNQFMKMPKTVDREKLNRAATSKALRGNNVGADAPAIQHEMVEKHRAAVAKAGGWLQLHAAIAFRSWRLGMNSVEVAESLSMTPAAVRQALWRMRDTAKNLGFDTGRAGYTAGKLRKPPKETPQLRVKFNSADDEAKAMQLRREGKTLNAISIEFGVTRATVWKVLRKAGIK